MTMRFDGHRYRDCKWCGGRGCLSCEAEANAAYKRAFPDGPKPFATFDISTPEGAERARRAIGPDALRKAFGPGGGGIADITEAAKASS
ncbi:hypothetical protein ACJ4V0_15755 [Phreatobacter sp. HK31-P]